MKKFFKWTGILVLAALIVLLLSGMALFLKGRSALEERFLVQPIETEAAVDSSSIAHGAHLAATLGCTDCHGSNLEGRVMIDAPPFRVVASNLTSGAGGVGQTYSDSDFDRALRQGVRPDRTPLIIMPSKAYHALANADAEAILGYIRSLPPVDNELPETTLKPLGNILAGSGQFDVGMEVTESVPTLDLPPPTAATVEYGKYRSETICSYCHQADYTGGVALGPGPIPTNIRPYGKIPLEEFISTMREGVTPAGRTLDAESMPTKVFKMWTDEELAAVHLFLGTLE